ncbi:MAG TPA: tricarballylate utilization 4Fe-4S protein TcuB [Citreicella sp.]|jgi:citrate/tricarballylate utilization protein|uniref:tricarballylate utilization 4Fe-4S protein TcuB n=1 Tax=Salipiger marinus TaxID=555512 RepID=UPI000E8AC40C|nr:tricarballylate utilization 4Fe-4S protein TcuB [Citreicella sp.]
MEHRTDALAEAERLMTVCNSCRYCEGLCAVFPAMEERRSFADADLEYLANLCHNCGACYHDCQFSPPHEFNVNVPLVLAQVRNDSYGHHAWPRALQPMFRRNGFKIAVATALTVTLFLLGMFAINGPDLVFSAHLAPENFYALMPHNVMVALFGTAFLFMCVAIVMSARSFWIATEGRDPDYPTGPIDIAGAGHDAATLRYLGGGGEGCMNADEAPDDDRKLWHHLTFYGFLLCFAATSVATLYHYLLGREAPYPWWDLPVVLGTLGGLGLVAGPVGLLRAKLRRLPDLTDRTRHDMDFAFISMLFATGLTGLLLVALRQTPAMGVLLALHLGVVMALFLTMPYSKFVHGIYRAMALVRHRREQRRHTAG